MASMTRSPLSVIIPGKAFWPIKPDRGGITTSATPAVRVRSVPDAYLTPYCAVSVLAWSLKSREIVAASRFGSSHSPKKTMMTIVPSTSGMPT